MKKTILIIGHPYWKDSVANRAIIEEFMRINSDAEISNISELYPDGNIQYRCGGRTEEAARCRHNHTPVPDHVV